MAISYQGLATLVINISAIFILMGIIVNTSLYRRRGKPEDKLFFAMVVTAIVAAILCCAVLCFYETYMPVGIRGFTVCMTLYYSSYALFGILWSRYLMYRMGWDDTKMKKARILVYLPAVIIVMLSLSNVYTYVLFGYPAYVGSVRIDTNIFFSLFPILVYGGISIALTWKTYKRVGILFVLLFAIQFFTEEHLDIDITPLLLAISLMYAHLFAIKDPFYEEVAES